MAELDLPMEPSASARSKTPNILQPDIAEHSIHGPVDGPVYGPVGKSTHESAEPADMPVDVPVGESVSEPADEPVQEPIEEHVDEPVEEPAEKHVEERVEEHIDEPAEEHVDEHVDKPVDEPASRTAWTEEATPETFNLTESEAMTRSSHKDTRVMQVIDLDDSEDDIESGEVAIVKIKKEDSPYDVMKRVIIQTPVPQEQAIMILDSDDEDEVPPGIYQPHYTDDTDKVKTEDSDHIIMSDKPFVIHEALADNTVVIDDSDVEVKIDKQDRNMESGLRPHRSTATPAPPRTATPAQTLPAVRIKLEPEGISSKPDGAIDVQDSSTKQPSQQASTSKPATQRLSFEHCKKRLLTKRRKQLLERAQQGLQKRAIVESMENNLSMTTNGQSSSIPSHSSTFNEADDNQSTHSFPEGSNRSDTEDDNLEEQPLFNDPPSNKRARDESEEEPESDAASQTDSADTNSAAPGQAKAKRVKRSKAEQIPAAEKRARTLATFQDQDGKNKKKAARKSRAAARGPLSNPKNSTKGSNRGKKATSDAVSRSGKARAASKKKGQTKQSKGPQIGLKTDSLFGRNIMSDANRNAGQAAQPGFSSSNKGKALKELLSNIPEEGLKMAKIDQNALLRASKSLNKEGTRRTVMPDGNGGWIIRGMRSSLFHYQLLGVEWMRNRESGKDNPRGGMLSDDMGYVSGALLWR